MNKVVELGNKVHGLRLQLKEAEAELRQAKLDDCLIKVGQKVKLTGRYKGEYGQVSSIEFFSFDSLWLTVKRFKKDGTLYTNSIRVFNDYEIIP